MGWVVYPPAPEYTIPPWLGCSDDRTSPSNACRQRRQGERHPPGLTNSDPFVLSFSEGWRSPERRLSVLRVLGATEIELAGLQANSLGAGVCFFNGNFQDREGNSEGGSCAHLASDLNITAVIFNKAIANG